MRKVEQMASLDHLAEERQRLTERLTRVDVERAKLTEQLAELDATERVLSRLDGAKSGTVRRGRRGKTAATTKAAAEVKKPPATPRRGRRAKAEPADKAATMRGRAAAAGRQRKRPAAKTAMPLRDATLRAVEGLGNASAEQIRGYLGEQFGMQVRPVHLGRALQSHRRAGRLSEDQGRWSMVHPASSEASAALH